MRYPSTVELPFNNQSIKDAFVPISSGLPLSQRDGYWLILQGNLLVVSSSAAGFELPSGPTPQFLPETCQPVCIGTWHGLPLRMVAVSRSVHLPEHFIAEAFNASGDRLDDATLTLGGMAMQILNWRKKSVFCSACGGELTAMSGHFGRICSACSYEHYPSIHPCAIVLVRRGNEFLLCRKKEWHPGRYGLVAGFLDMSESLEECAAREVLEETGIVVKNVRYVGSQCWPFPSQLMAGFVAEYESGEIEVDYSELEDARWFSSAAPPIGLPPQRSIARWIIDRYMLNG